MRTYLYPDPSMELSGTYTIVLYSPYPAQVWVIGSSIVQNQQHKSPWLQIIVHLGHGTCTTEAINGLTVEVKAVAWRDPEDGLEIEDVELLQHPLETGGSTKLTTGHGSITPSWATSLDFNQQCAALLHDAAHSCHRGATLCHNC